MVGQQFDPIDLNTWERAQHFYYFSKMAKTGFSMNVEIDITTLLNEAKVKGIKFYPAYLHSVTTGLNQCKEFKVAYCDEVLGSWDSLTPVYAVFHEDDKTFSLMWTEYHEDFSVFYQRYLSDHQQYGDQHGILAKPNPPKSSYTVSCVPWISFKSFAVHSYGLDDYFFPTVEAGKYYEKDGKIVLPLSITAHHAVCDGYHIHLFLQTLQDLCDTSIKWLNI
jgi:chloramphenicol O-acetyltransferase type A